MPDIRDQLSQIYSSQCAIADIGDTIVVPDVEVLYSIIEQLVSRIEQLEAKAS